MNCTEHKGGQYLFGMHRESAVAQVVKSERMCLDRNKNAQHSTKNKDNEAECNEIISTWNRRQDKTIGDLLASTGGRNERRRMRKPHISNQCLLNNGIHLLFP